MYDEVCQQDVESLPLPKNWYAFARIAVLNVIGIIRIAMLAGRQALIDNGHVKEARIHQLESEVSMLREELRINGARIQRVAPHRRPQYTSVERMAILKLRAVRGWNKAETARLAQRRRSLLTARPAIRLSFKSTASRVVAICQFFVFAVWRNHCEECKSVRCALRRGPLGCEFCADCQRLNFPSR